MNRDELLERITIGAEFLERGNLSPHTKEVAQARYDELVAQLREMDARDSKEAKKPAALSTEPMNEADRVKMCMDAIRSILKPIDKRG